MIMLCYKFKKMKYILLIVS